MFYEIREKDIFYVFKQKHKKEMYYNTWCFHQNWIKDSQMTYF